MKLTFTNEEVETIVLKHARSLGLALNTCNIRSYSGGEAVLTWEEPGSTIIACTPEKHDSSVSDEL